MSLKTGDLAPDFELQDDSGNLVRLSDLQGKPVVLYFYPKDNTPGCTTEACDFRDNFARVQNKGVTVLGVSPDSVTSHKKFKEKHSLPFPLLADVDKKVAEMYGAWGEKRNYGKVYFGIIRSTFLINSGGEIAVAWPKVKVKGHVDEVLSALDNTD